MMFQAPNEGLHNATQMLFRNWHLSRMGAPFDQVLADEIGSTDLPRYRLYIMANTFYLSSAERERIHQALKRDGAAVLWVYAPGYLDDHSASLANITSLTGITVGMSDIEAELDVKLNRFDHPLTQGLDGLSYGTGIDREQYLAPPKTQYLPETQISPAFYADDPDALVLGVAASTGKPGLVVKELDGYTAVYSAAPVLSWQVLRNLACWAGVHLYGDQGDMVWANRAFLCFYAQSAGRRVVALPRTCDVYDAYESRLLARSTDQIELDMAQWETRLLLLQ